MFVDADGKQLRPGDKLECFTVRYYRVILVVKVTTYTLIYKAQEGTKDSEWRGPFAAGVGGISTVYKNYRILDRHAREIEWMDVWEGRCKDAGS